jgi:cytochrome c oxidase subunit 2
VFLNGTQGNQACSYCHTLRAARAAGIYAPNLDQDISEDRRAGMSEGKVAKLVRDLIHDGVCIDPKDPSRCMPAQLASGQDAQDVSAFVARCANNPGAQDCLAPTPSNPLAARGQRLFASLRCQGCHSTDGNVAIAPTFKGLAGSKVELASGKTVAANDDYLTVSILAPDVQIVKGYKPGFMTQVIGAGDVSGGQARAIVAFIKTLK